MKTRRLSGSSSSSHRRRPGVQRLPVRSAADACLRAAGFARGWLAWVTQLFQRFVEPEYILVNASTTTADEHDRRLSAATTRRRTPSTVQTPTTTPTGVAIFADDFQSIRRFAERDHADIVSWNRYDRGSHFSPDAPELLLDDIRQFFRALR